MRTGYTGSFCERMASVRTRLITVAERRARLVRMTGMRTTLFVVPVGLAPVVHAAFVAGGAAGSREHVLWSIRRAGITEDAEAWLAPVEQAALRLLRETGGATATELAELEPRLGIRIPVAETENGTALLSLSVRLLLLLAAEGRALRGRPQGSWTNGRYRWSPIENWWPAGMTVPPPASARAEVVRRWLAAYGPGTVADLKWWTGRTVREVRQILTEVGAVTVMTDGGPAYVLPEDVDEAPPAEPWVALLPALDSTVMGWRDRDWYLGDLQPWLFDRNGNAGPTVWCDGRVVGAWAQRRDGEVVFRLLAEIGDEARAAVAKTAEGLAGWLGGVRVTPRFRTPLERELCA